MPTIVNGSKYMQAVLYTGTGSTQTITCGFQPDLVWIKSRSAATDHKLTDSVRGVTKALISDTTGAETTDTNGLTAFTSTGFTIGSDSVYNTNGATYVAWCWNAGSGSSSSNTSGSITSTVSVNATAGFSVVTCTTPASGAFTIGHGLGVVPKMIIVKDRANATGWPVYHASVTTQNEYLLLNTTAAKATLSGMFGSALPTSTVFGQTVGAGVNANIGIVAYCFSEVSGYSKAFSLTGNGSTDGSFVYLGFLPRMILLKRTDTTGNWYIWDTSRNTYNVLGEELYPNLSNAASSATDLDILSNGFKLRNSTAGFNANGGTYIGFAWATNPFKNSLAF